MNASAPPVSISDDMIDWLLKLKTLCEENDVELLVTKVPSIQLPAVYGSAWTCPRSDEVRRICQENGIPFFDILYDVPNSINPATDFSDGGMHVNFLGTQKISSILGDYLVNHYTLDTASLPMWDTDLKTYKKVRNVALLQLDFQFESYLSRLKDCFADKTIFISASDEMSSALTDKEKELLLYRKLDYPESSEKTAYSPAFYKKIRDNFSILLRHFRWDWNDIFLKFGIIFFLHHRP